MVPTPRRIRIALQQPQQGRDRRAQRVWEAISRGSGCTRTQVLGNFARTGYASLMSALEEILATIRQLPLPERLRLIERAKLEADEDTPKPAAVTEGERKLTVDEFLGARLTPPPGLAPVTLHDMDRAIAHGASGRGIP